MVVEVPRMRDDEVDTEADYRDTNPVLVADKVRGIEAVLADHASP